MLSLQSLKVHLTIDGLFPVLPSLPGWQPDMPVGLPGLEDPLAGGPSELVSCWVSAGSSGRQVSWACWLTDIFMLIPPWAGRGSLLQRCAT